ncbi:MAG: hypothetical protein WD793_05515 [Steroidobacteraceae bacterium]
MSKQAATRLREHLTQFLEAPTRQRQATLVAAADEYREHWIEAQAAENAKLDDDDGGGQPATRYRRIHSVLGFQPDGTEITLALQSRTSVHEGKTWNVVSWRTRLEPGGHNRRFYVTKDDVWTIDVHAALAMYTKLEQLGGLGDEFRDQRNPEFQVTVSDDVNAKDRAAMLEEITLAGEDWGENPYFIVLNDPNDDWRKILIVNRRTDRATFRSTTTNAAYMPRKTMRPNSRWFLDNSMQDVNVQQARVIYAELQRITIALGRRSRPS